MGLLGDVTVVPAQSDAWLARHAADELARFVHEMTGARVHQVDGTGPAPVKADLVITLALGQVASRLRDMPGGDDPGRLRDGFVIKSADHHLTIGALEPIGLLYGVYDYLERHCGCGFFWDGDSVPSQVNLPVEGIDEAVLPRWPVRHFSAATGFGLAKWHDQFRSLNQRRQVLDWMAKRKINRSGHYMGKHIAHSGLASARTFGISDREPDNFTFAGWPGALDWPAQVRTEHIKFKLDQGRQRGIRWIIQVPYGDLPHQFRQMHPEYRYVGHLGYSATVLYPDDPQCDHWAKAFYRSVIDLYGTDHIYMDTPFVESTGAADDEQSFQLKLVAAQRMCATLKAIDPEAIWQSDSWDFGAQSGVWTPPRIKKYFASLPTDMMRIYDTAGLLNPFYERTNYFEGVKWTLAILHSFQGDDHLHGDLRRAIHVVQALAQDPKAVHCEGIYHVPEISGHNLLFFDLTTRLSWDPDGITLAGHLDSYVRRRYGEHDFGTMRSALDAVVEAAYRGGGHVAGGGNGQTPIYQKLGCHYGPVAWWPIVDDKEANHPAREAEGIDPLHRALRLALACRESQQRNPLYVNDMVDWAREYLAHVFNWAVVNAYHDFKAGDAASMASRIETARLSLRHIERILSTRPDFSLHAQIQRVMKVPGTNPHTPWYMKKHCVNDLYSNNEVYEQLHWYYGPRIEVYFEELEKRANAGETNIQWVDIADRCKAVEDHWLDEDIEVPERFRYGGTTMDAVVEGVEALEPHVKEVPPPGFRDAKS